MYYEYIHVLIQSINIFLHNDDWMGAGGLWSLIKVRKQSSGNGYPPLPQWEVENKNI
jgi:hypothetical protein